MKIKFCGPFSIFWTLLVDHWQGEAWTWTFLAHHRIYLLAKWSTTFQCTHMKVKFSGPFSTFVDLFGGSLAKKGLDMDLSHPKQISVDQKVHKFYNMRI